MVTSCDSGGSPMYLASHDFFCSQPIVGRGLCGRFGRISCAWFVRRRGHLRASVDDDDKADGRR